MNPEYTNDLIHETSPYLLQHAHNPVNWVPWGEKAMKDALETNKLIIVSIGYSTCHWCHVMERESFEDEEVAGLMNAHFVNIKVDREERPDLDQIYMAAVQLMTGTGGWPLNCICLPDGRPIYGGTYFPKEQWMSILRNLTHLYRDEPEKVRDYADKLEQGIKDFELIEKQEGDILSKADLEEMVLRWSKNFDMREGGPNKAPKFPLPNNYEFLLRYAFHSEIPEIKNHVDLTLQKMALGGIYDQIGGGFSRYSVDVLWKVPHFEKMLYDNGQLIGLYAKAYQWTKNDLYKEVVYQTVDWLEREMRDSSGAFYSAIDADSEGVEGKFYVWNKAELKSILDSEMYNFALKYFSVDSRGLWDGNYILLRTERDDVFARKNNMTVTELKQKKSQLIQILFDAREYRLRPGLDDKSLTSWNAIAIKGLLTAYRVFGEKDFFTLAKSCLLWIEKSQWTEEKLWRTYKSAPHSEDKASVGGTKGKSGIEAFLDDYAFLIDTYIEFYTTTLDEAFLKKARQLTLMAVSKFWDNERAMFYYTPEGQKDLIARKMEVGDNVIPASNSVMAKNLYALSRYYGDPDFRDMAVQMLVNVSSFMSDYGSGYSNWAMLAMDMLYPSYELVLTGKDQKKYLDAFNQSYYPHVLVAGGETEEVPILKNRLSDKTLFYLCVNGSCRLPEEKWEKILETIGSEKY